MIQLHDEGTPELENINDFLQELRMRFDNTDQGHEVKVETKAIKQRGHPTKEYIREFWRLTGKLWYWPECLLVRYFKEGLEKELHNVIRGCVSSTPSMTGTG